MDALTEQRIRERAEIIYESDARCACGADPVAVRAHVNPAWHIDAVQYPDHTRADVICPSCLAGETSDEEW